jgi:outer membrane protein assembly factor BamB
VRVGRGGLGIAAFLLVACGPDTDAMVVALDARTGAYRWSQDLGTPKFTSALVAFGAVEIGGWGVCGGAAGTFAFDLDSGDTRDPRELEAIDVSGPDALLLDPEAIELLLVDSATGDLSWRAPFPCQPQEDDGPCSLDDIDVGLAGDLALVSQELVGRINRAVLEAHARQDGGLRWSVTVDRASTASVVRNQTGSSELTLVWIQGSGAVDRIAALESGTGEARWVAEVTRRLASGRTYPLLEATASQGAVVFPLCGPDNEPPYETWCGLVSLDGATGEALWSFETEAGSADNDTGAYGNGSAVDDTGAYAVVGDSYAMVGDSVVALDPRTGQTRWRASLLVPPRSNLVVDGERVYAVVQDGAVVALDVDDGSERWRAELPDAMATDDLVQLVLGAEDVYVIGESDEFEQPSCGN